MKSFSKIFFVTIIFFGIFVFAQTSHAAPLTVHPTNPRYFTDGSGKAIYLTGFQYWDMLLENSTQDPTSPDFSQFLNTANQFDNNYIRLWIWNELSKFCYGTCASYASSYPVWQRTGPGNAKDGKLKFDLTKFDQSYFDCLRQRVIQARDQGYYVGIMLFEGHSLYWSAAPWRWDGHPFNVNNNINGINGDPNGDGYGGEIRTLQYPSITALQEAYVRRVIDTVNDLDNVLYEISNEDQKISKDWQYHLINYIHSYEATKSKQHPVGMSTYYEDSTVTPRIFNNSALFASNAEFISPTKKYDGLTYDYGTNPPSADGAKVMLLDSDHIFPQDGDRVWVWKSFTRGNNVILYCNIANPNAKQITARPAIGHTLAYANKMNLVAMLPSASSSDCSTTYCLRNPGQEYLIYQPGSGSFTINLAAGIYTYEWFNTITGAIVSTGTVTQAASGNKSFTPAFSEAVLYLKKQVADTQPPAAPTGLTVQ